MELKEELTPMEITMLNNRISAINWEGWIYPKGTELMKETHIV